MKNVFTFVLKSIIDNSLYVVHFDNSDEDEFTNAFDNWSDIEYLENFFNENKSLLCCEFYDYISVAKAIEQTTKEAEELEEQLLEIAETGKNNSANSLQTLFKPLNNNEKSNYPIPKYQKSKVYGSYPKSWLRIYAVRIDVNLFVITGSAIKLTAKMDESEHLRKELKKLELVKKYLISENIIDNDSLIEFVEI